MQHWVTQPQSFGNACTATCDYRVICADNDVRTVQGDEGGIRRIKGPGGVPPGHDGVKKAPSSGGLFGKVCIWTIKTLKLLWLRPTTA